MKFLRPLLKIFFTLLYGPFAWTYDLVAAIVSLGMWRGWVLSVLPYLDGPRVLELGYGPGHLQLALGQAGIKSFGLDASQQMGRLARHHLQHRGYPCRLARGIGQNLPFVTHSFDQVVATFPTEYIVASDALGEIHRVLAPGGTLVILPVAWITGRGWHHWASAKLFEITGQAPAWDERFLEPICQAGFTPHIERIKQKDSSLLIIIGKINEVSTHGQSDQLG